MVKMDFQGNGWFRWISSWWFQPIWKILLKLDHFPNFRGENKKCWNHHLRLFEFQVYKSSNPYLCSILHQTLRSFCRKKSCHGNSEFAPWMKPGRHLNNPGMTWVEPRGNTQPPLDHGHGKHTLRISRDLKSRGGNWRSNSEPCEKTGRQTCLYIGGSQLILMVSKFGL